MHSGYMLGISTYLKPEALNDLLESLEKFGYSESCTILVTDDDPNHSAKDTALKFANVMYLGASKRCGIAIQKNRSIKYFLNETKCEKLILLDDDIIFRHPGLLEELDSIKLHHITGYLGQWEDGVGVLGMDDRPQLSKNPYSVDFPRQGQTEDGKISFRFGSQGGMLFFSRAILEKAGYFHIPPGKYGYEHSIHSNVINRVQGYCIDWFPILENSPKFFHDNGKYANAYEAKPQENNDWWINKKREIQKGINFINRSHGVPENEEVLKI